jgi:hypothetical protein
VVVDGDTVVRRSSGDRGPVTSPAPRSTAAAPWISPRASRVVVSDLHRHRRRHRHRRDALHRLFQSGPDNLGQADCVVIGGTGELAASMAPRFGPPARRSRPVRQRHQLRRLHGLPLPVVPAFGGEPPADRPVLQEGGAAASRRASSQWRISGSCGGRGPMPQTISWRWCRAGRPSQRR